MVIAPEIDDRIDVLCVVIVLVELVAHEIGDPSDIAGAAVSESARLVVIRRVSLCGRCD